MMMPAYLNIAQLFSYLSLGLFSALALCGAPLWGHSRARSLPLLGGIFLTCCGAFWAGILDGQALGGLIALGVLYYGATTEGRAPAALMPFLWVAAMALAVGFYTHQIPGVHNVQVLQDVMLTQNALPFTMYLNMDKVAAALILFALSPWLIHSPGLSRATGLSVVTTALTAIIVLAVAAFGIGYIAWAPKFPHIFWIWALNNFFFVCFAEEVLFRGIIQTKLIQSLSMMGQSLRTALPLGIVLSAILYGIVGAVASGPLYGIFMGISGVFYGSVYVRTQSLLAAVLVHFAVNAAHFLLFTYPACAL